MKIISAFANNMMDSWGRSKIRWHLAKNILSNMKLVFIMGCIFGAVSLIVIFEVETIYYHIFWFLGFALFLSFGLFILHRLRADTNSTVDQGNHQTEFSGAKPYNITHEGMRDLLDQMDAGILMVDCSFKHILWNNAYENLFNFPKGFLKADLSLQEAIRWFYNEEGYSEEKIDQLYAKHVSLIEKTKTDKTTVHQIDRSDGRIIDISIKFVDDGSIIFNFLDVTKREQANVQSLFQMGQRESLTGYPNRFLLKSYLKKVLNKAQRDQHSFTLIQLNMVNFQSINEAYGLSTGDILITTMAQRLSCIIHENEFLAHLGGDSFAVVGGFNKSKVEMIKHVQEMQQKISAPLTIQNSGKTIELIIEMSAGITHYPDDNNSVDDLFLNTEIALNIAKKNKPGSVIMYNTSMQTEIRDRNFLVSNMRESIARNQFVLHYQPQINLKSLKISGIEALLRWQHPEKGWISPGEFIPLAELTNLIIPLTEQLLPQACNQARLWQDQGLAPFPVSVNISPLHFLDDSFVPLVKNSLADANLKPKWLELEITEGVIMNRSQEVIAKLDELSDMGISLAIDDFGTGYSSLTYLRALPVDKLKIDQAFITDLTDEGDSRSVIEAIIKLGHSFNLKIIAEGVEDMAVLDILRNMRCDNAQGYHIARPMAGEKIVDWVNDYYLNAAQK